MYSDKYIIRIVELHDVKKFMDVPVEQMSKKERYKIFIALVGYEEAKSKIDEIVKEEEGLAMTLAEIYKTVEEKDIPTALMNWAAEYNMIQNQRYEEERERELKDAKAETRKALDEVAKAKEENEILKEMLRKQLNA